MSKSVQVQDQAVLASAVNYHCYRRESGKCLWQSIGYERTLYSYKGRLLRVHCSVQYRKVTVYTSH